MGRSNLIHSRLASNIVVVLDLPKGVEGIVIVKKPCDEYRAVIAGTRNCLAGRVVRFGVMKYTDFETVLTDWQKLKQVPGHSVIVLQSDAECQPQSNTTQRICRQETSLNEGEY